MTATAERPIPSPSAARRPGGLDVDVVVPVYNEEAGLGLSVSRLHAYLSESFPLSWRITIVDNASTDGTWALALRLASELEPVHALHLDRKGRGLALRTAWTASTARVVAYMDVDLSTDLGALLPLVAPLLTGHSDLAIGSRLAPDARVVRGPKRELVSRSYNLVLRATIGNRFSDAQCGFKAARTDVAQALLPLVEDNAWFFDTELLAVAEHNGLRIHEVPVDWVDDPDSRVDVTQTAIDDLRGVWRLLRRFAAGDGILPRPAPGEGRVLAIGGGPAPAPRREVVPSPAGQIIRFAGIGLVATLLFAMLFLATAPLVGAYGADALALALCAMANVAANRRLTFAAYGGPGRSQQYRRGLAIGGLLPLTLGFATLAVLRGGGHLGLFPALLGLTVANAMATVVRLAVLRHWVYGTRVPVPVAPAVQITR